MARSFASTPDVRSGRAIVYRFVDVRSSVVAGRDLAQRLEAAHEHSIVRYCASLARLDPERHVASMAVCGGHAVYAGRSPFSSATGLALQQPISATELRAVEDFYHGHNAPVRVEVCLHSHESLVRLLEERRYRLAEITTVLYRQLSSSATAAQPLAAGIDVRCAQSEDAECWASFLARCFYVSDPGPDRRRDLMAMFLVPHSLNCMGYVDGVLSGVGGGMLPPSTEDATLPYGPAPEEKIATFYGGCTLPGARNRGLHAAILHHRLQRAAAAGCRMVLATATPGSDAERNLLRHGFYIAYEKRTFIRSNKNRKQ